MATHCRICSTRNDCPICEARNNKVESLIEKGLSRSEAERAERAIRDPLWWSEKDLEREFQFKKPLAGERPGRVKPVI